MRKPIIGVTVGTPISLKKIKKEIDPIVASQHTHYIKELWGSLHDSTTAYSKDVPAKAAPYAKINKIGGMTYKDGDTLKSAPVTEVESVGANLLDSRKISKSNINGISIEYLKDEDCFLINGTATHTGMRSHTAVNIPLKKHTLYRTTNSYVSGTVTRPTSGNGYALTYIGYNNPDTTNPNWFSCDLNMSDSGWSGNNYNATTLTHFWFYIDAGVSFNNYKVRVMIYEGDALLPYRPFTRNTLPIPEAVRPKNGINENVYDYIEWCEDGTRKSYKRLGVVDLGTLNWNRSSSGRSFNAQLKDAVDMACGGGGVCSKYDVRYSNDNKSLYTTKITSEVSCVVVDSDYTDAAAFKAAMSGVMLYYELAEPIITDISDILSADNFIGVEGGGTLTFKNEYEFAVPSEVVTDIEVASGVLSDGKAALQIGETTITEEKLKALLALV